VSNCLLLIEIGNRKYKSATRISFPKVTSAEPINSIDRIAKIPRPRSTNYLMKLVHDFFSTDTRSFTTPTRPFKTPPCLQPDYHLDLYLDHLDQYLIPTRYTRPAQFTRPLFELDPTWSCRCRRGNQLVGYGQFPYKHFAI
jgi:hypothetical protein